MPLMQYPGRIRSLGPPNPLTPPVVPQPGQPFNLNLALQKLANRRVVAPVTPFNNYTGRSMGSPVGMFNRVPGFGRMFRG